MNTPAKEEITTVPKDSLTLERIALTAVVGLLSWNVYSTNQLQITQARMDEQMSGIRDTVTLISENAVNPTDYAITIAEIRAFNHRIEQWVSRLSDRQRMLEEDAAVLKRILEETSP